MHGLSTPEEATECAQQELQEQRKQVPLVSPYTLEGAMGTEIPL